MDNLNTRVSRINRVCLLLKMFAILAFFVLNEMVLVTISLPELAVEVVLSSASTF